MLFFRKIFLKNILLYIQRGKKVYQKRAKPISVTIAINSLLLKQGKFFVIGNCSGKPGVVYNFNNQCLISYQDNFRAKRDAPFVVYLDFETTAPADNCLDPEQKKMFVVSYVMIVDFHPELKLDGIIIYGSFAHSVGN